MITKIRPKRDVRSRFHSLCETDLNSITSLGLEPKSDIMLKLDYKKIILSQAMVEMIATFTLSTEKIWSRTVEPRQSESRHKRDAHGPNALSNSHHASMRPHQKGGSSPWQDSVEILLLFVHHTFSWQSLVRGPYMLVTCFALWADRTVLHAVTQVVHFPCWVRTLLQK